MRRASAQLQAALLEHPRALALDARADGAADVRAFVYNACGDRLLWAKGPASAPKLRLQDVKHCLGAAGELLLLPPPHGWRR